MMNIRKRLANLYTHHSDRSMSQQNYGKARSPDEMLSAMSDAIPDDDKKWQLTNIGGIGSDEDKELREKAAESEAEFDGAGEQPGLEMWRIEKFSPQRVDISSSKLSLFSGDCYIVLKTIQKDDSDALEWHIHYWIGKDSTQDESGSAAYFAVNLDDMLGQKPVQHREVQFAESALFHSYFRSVTYLDGGIDSGFKKAEPETYQARLLQMVSLGESVRVVQVELVAGSLNDSDVFILDDGLTIYQFNSPHASVRERRRAMEVVHEDLRAPRDLEPELVILDGDEVFACEPFWDRLGGKVDTLPEVGGAAEGGEDTGESIEEPISDDVDFTASKTLCKISNESGELILSLEKEQVDHLVQDDVNDADVWAVACDGWCFVYVGGATNKDEKFYVWNNCDVILAALGLPVDTNITFISKASDSATWDQLFD